MSILIPNVIEKTPNGERHGDIFSRLLRENIIFLGTPIDDMVANVISAQLLHLEAENPERDISIYINSPGGDINALFAIYDTMQYIKPDVTTICSERCLLGGHQYMLVLTEDQLLLVKPKNSKTLDHIRFP